MLFLMRLVFLCGRLFSTMCFYFILFFLTFIYMFLDGFMEVTAGNTPVKVTFFTDVTDGTDRAVVDSNVTMVNIVKVLIKVVAMVVNWHEWLQVLLDMPGNYIEVSS